MITLGASAALPAFLETRDSFDAFVRAWEAGNLPKAQWTHGAHVAMGAVYVVRYGTTAVDQMRRGIKRHNAAVGTADTEDSGYHETLTCFWTGVLGRTVAGCSDPWLAARLAVERFGEDRNLHRLNYSFDVVKDRAARAAWVPPDRIRPWQPGHVRSAEPGLGPRPPRRRRGSSRGRLRRSGRGRLHSRSATPRRTAWLSATCAGGLRVRDGDRILAGLLRRVRRPLLR